VSGVVTIIQARTRSTRLPGKVLLPLGRGSVLDVMLDRVKAARLVGTVVVATTTNVEDDAIESIARRNNVACYRGHPTDLLDRHYGAALAHGATHVVKIPSDCPLIDPAVIDAVLAAYLARQGQLDFVSNLHPPTHPDGNDVEIMRFSTLATAWHEATRPFEREHTTPYIWNHPERFRMANVVWARNRDCSLSHRVVLDYPADYDVIRAVYTALAVNDPLFSIDDIVRYLDAHPRLMERNASHRGVYWYRDHLDELPALAPRRHQPAARAS
jgi:spore coat polysaccharide biosynthesis protein SpsF